MTIYIEDLIIFILCSLFYPWGEVTAVSLVYVLLSLILACFLMILKWKPVLLALGVMAVAAGILYPDFICFFPALFYPICYRGNYVLPLCGCLLAVFFRYETPLFILLFFFSCYLALRGRERAGLQAAVIELRDSSVEQQLRLKQNQKQLLARQDDKIYIATLKERNRIAREIHDNVGHMLSRSILQTGALLAMYKEDAVLSPYLMELKTSLDEAMDNIRNSVHDLHNESIDLREALQELADSFRFCPVRLDCQISGWVPKEIQYCFIAIVKESLNNIMKHSNATKVSILVKEHPGLYQLFVEDNGSGVFSISDASGIGLSNMRDRVEALQGMMHIDSDHGVKIFISIPKE